MTNTSLQVSGVKDLEKKLNKIVKEYNLGPFVHDELDNKYYNYVYLEEITKNDIITIFKKIVGQIVYLIKKVVYHIKNTYSYIKKKFMNIKGKRDIKLVSIHGRLMKQKFIKANSNVENEVKTVNDSLIKELSKLTDQTEKFIRNYENTIKRTPLLEMLKLMDVEMAEIMENLKTVQESSITHGRIIDIDENELSLWYDDMLEDEYRRNIEDFPSTIEKCEKANELLSEDYNSLVQLHLEAIVKNVRKYLDEGIKPPRMNGLFKKIARLSYKYNLTDEELRNFLVNKMIRVPNDIDEARELASLYHEYTINIVNSIQSIIENNYRILNLSLEEKNIISSLDKPTSIKIIKSIIEMNSEKFYKGNGIYDFREIKFNNKHLGVLVYSLKKEDRFYLGSSIYQMTQSLIDWDICLIGHGVNDKTKTWKCLPMMSPGGAGPFEIMDDLVLQCIKEGFKNILIISCNAHGNNLSKKIRDMRGIKIHHAMRDMISEQMKVNITSLTNK